MSSLSKGTTFVDGNSYNAAALNNLVDNATILSGAITDRGAVVPDVADSVLLYDSSGSSLAKCTLQDVINIIPANAAAGTTSLRKLGTGSTDAAAGNDTRFPATLSSNVGAIRKIGTAGLGSNDVAATPPDFRFTPVDLAHGSTVDWDAGDVFFDTGLTSNTTYTFNNVRAGRVIILQINQNGKTVTLPGGWTLFGTANTAGWNIYTLVNSSAASQATVVN